MNEAYMNLLERRSIRRYDSRPVPDELQKVHVCFVHKDTSQKYLLS